MTVSDQPSSTRHGSTDELDRLVGGAHHDPHAILGAHDTGDGRTRHPHAAPGRQPASSS